MGGPTVNLIITSSLSKQYKEKQPFTVFQTALQNMLILSYLYQCDIIINQQRINRKQNSFSFPVTHYLFCVCVCVCVAHGLGPWGSFCIGLSLFLFFFLFVFFFWGGVFLREIVLVVALQRSVTSCLLVMSQCKIGIVITDL